MKREPLSRLTVMVTYDCNLGCVGCVTNAQFGRLGKRIIDKDFALEAIKMFYSPARFEKPYLFFSGRGEPTLRIDIIEAIVSEASNFLDDPYIGIQTNGVFDVKTRQRINEISDLVWMSVDGRPEINDGLRPMRKGNASEYLAENIPALMASGTPVRWRSTIYPRNCSAVEQKSLVDYAKQCGIDIVVCEPAIISPSRTNTGDDIYLVSISKFIEGFIEANQYAASIGITYITGLMEEAQKLHDIGTRKRCSECFAIDPLTALPKSATLTTDNRMVGCYLGYEDNDTMEVLTFGRWKNGRLVIDRERLRELGQADKNNNCCFGRSLLGNSRIEASLLEKVRKETKYPVELPYHS